MFHNNNFIFNRFIFSKRHYTDSRKGSPFNYLAYMVKGESKIISDRKTIYIKAGDMFFIPENLSYQSHWSGEEIEFLSFGFHTLHTNENINFDLQVIPCTKSTVKKIIDIPTQNENVSCRAISMFYYVMADLMPDIKCRTENKGKTVMANIKKCIRKYPHSSMSEIAGMCSISEPYLYMLFKKEENITPNEYRQKILCEMAVELLVTTDKKIEEISEMLSFSTSSYFRKVLKKHTGKTPSEIKKSRIF